MATVSGTRFIVTGFGRFFDAEDNPTQHLVEWLSSLSKAQQQGQRIDQSSDELLTNTLPAKGSPCSGHAGPTTPLILHTCVLKVAAQDVDAWFASEGELDTVFAQLDTDLQPSLDRPVVLLHLGVDSKAQGFSLESTAYNNANFRRADERGWHPQDTPIDPDLPLDCPAPCPLDLASMHAELCGQGFPVNVSTDPGRFVCNYTYWRSLRRCSTSRGVDSLFIHVPPFTVLPEQQQRSFILAALQVVAGSAASTPQAAAH